MTTRETSEADVERLAFTLTDARRRCTPTAPMTTLIAAGLDVELAHAICERNVASRLAGGETLTGYKVGFTSLPGRSRLGFPDSMYGYIFDSTVLSSGAQLPMRQFIAPWIEAEVCFRLGTDIAGGDPSVDDVLAATDAVSASFEICDARVPDWRDGYADSFADNGYAAYIVVSNRWLPPGKLDLVAESVELYQDGLKVAEGTGEAALGHPAKAVAWLANKLARRGRKLSAGSLVMSGSLTPIHPIKTGATYTGAFSSLGSVEAAFI